MNNDDQRIAHIKKTLAELRSTSDHAKQLIDDLSLNLDHLRSPGPPAPVDHRGDPRSGGPGDAPAPADRPPRPPHPGPPAPPRQPAPPRGPGPTAGPPPPPFSQSTQPVARPGQPPAFIAQQLPRPVKQPLTTEQKVIRAAAVLGSIITFIGASFGVALAIQSGLLGPVGRAVGALLFVLILLGIGVRIDIRHGAQPGVTALYATSFLVVLADLAYMTHSQHWLSPTGLNVAALAVWIAFLGLGILRKNMWLVLCMCIAFLFFAGPIYDHSVTNALLPMFYPPLALVCTWIIPSTTTPRLAVATRLLTAAMLIRQLILLSFVTWFQNDLGSVPLVAYVGVFLLIIGDRYFPIWQLSLTTRHFTSIYAPAAVILTSYTVIWWVSLWVPVVVTLAATTLIGVLRFRARDPEQAAHGDVCLSAWLGILPFTFVPVIIDAGATAERRTLPETISVVVFLVVFAAVLVLMRFQAAHKVPLLTAWSVALFFAIHNWIPSTIFSSLARYASAYDLAVGLALIAFLGFAASEFGLWRSLKPAMRNLFAAAGLLFSVVGIVTVSTAIGELVSPNCYSKESSTPEIDPDSGCGEPQGFQVGFFVGHMIVSISWMALAAWLIVKRPRPGADPKAARVAGLVIAICATAKLVLFDMASLSGVPRVITFVVCGLLLIAVAVLGAQRNGDSAGRRDVAPGSFPAHGNAVPNPYDDSATQEGVDPFPNVSSQPAFADAPQAPQRRNPGTENPEPRISVAVSRGPEPAPEQKSPQGPFPEHGDMANEKTKTATEHGQAAGNGTPAAREASGRDIAGPEADPG